MVEKAELVAMQDPKLFISNRQPAKPCIFTPKAVKAVRAVRVVKEEWAELVLQEDEAVRVLIVHVNLAGQAMAVRAVRLVREEKAETVKKADRVVMAAMAR